MHLSLLHLLGHLNIHTISTSVTDAQVTITIVSKALILMLFLSAVTSASQISFTEISQTILPRFLDGKEGMWVCKADQVIPDK